MLPRRQFDNLLGAVKSVGLHLFLTSLVPQLFVRVLLRLSIGCRLNGRGRVCIQQVKGIIRVIFIRR
jgi:hypothetical protein